MLEALRRARTATPSETTATLRAALTSRNAIVVAAAAGLASELEVGDVARDAAEAFAWFLDDAVERDRGCAANAAIARALARLEWSHAEPFLTGVRHVQIEPAYPRPADTAAELRATSAVALAAMRHPDAVEIAVEPLVDPERTARAGAAHALGTAGVPESVPVLRLEALSGDPDPEVLTECFLSLLALRPKASLAFVARFLGRGDATRRPRRSRSDNRASRRRSSRCASGRCAASAPSVALGTSRWRCCGRAPRSTG